MLKDLLKSPEKKQYRSLPEQGLIRSMVHKRMIEHKHVVPAARNAIDYMFSEISISVKNRVKNWGKNADGVLPVEIELSRELKDKYSEELHKNDLDIYENVEELRNNVTTWLEVPKDPAEVSFMKGPEGSDVVQQYERGDPVTRRSDGITAARDRLRKITDPNWHEMYDQTQGGDESASLVQV